jgi:hypothetical protein
VGEFVEKNKLLLVVSQDNQNKLVIFNTKNSSFLVIKNYDDNNFRSKSHFDGKYAYYFVGSKQFVYDTNGKTIRENSFRYPGGCFNCWFESIGN